jgi:hypothetical protein
VVEVHLARPEQRHPGGRVGRDLDHDAEFYHWEIGYAFNAAWSPVLLLQFDSASGDEDPFDNRNDGFDTLFGERRFDFAPQRGRRTQKFVRQLLGLYTVSLRPIVARAPHFTCRRV